MNLFPSSGWWLAAVLPVMAAPTSGWQAIRDHQPAALHLVLTLPAGPFAQGQEIDAKLAFANDDPSLKMSLWLGAGAPGAVFHAFDERGEDVPNPRQWIEWLPVVVTGPVSLHELGRYAFSLPVNESLTFTHPGIYRVYAEAGLAKGKAPEGGPRVEIVSDPVTVTIGPPDPAAEKAEIDKAVSAMAGADEEAARRTIARLGYLNTPAAWDQLISFLGNPKFMWFAHDALMGSTDPAQVAGRILAAASQGKLVLDDNGGLFFGTLNAAHLLQGTSPLSFPEPEREKRYAAFAKEQQAGLQKLMQVQLEATAGQGARHVEALWAAFRNDVVHHRPGERDSAARAALLPHQLELSDDDVGQLLEDWPEWGLEGFLPLLQREAAPPHRRLTALIGWAQLDPASARSLVIKELRAADCRFFNLNYPASIVLPAVTPMPLPQFDRLFRAKLKAAGGNPFPLIPVIGAFGSPALLPDVIKAYREHGKTPQGNWDDAILTGLFLYWLRADPPGGAAALEKEIDARGRDGWGLLETVFRNSSSDGAMPVMKWALAGPPPLATTAVSLLEAHAGERAIDLILATLERLHGQTIYANYVPREAGRLLASTRWTYTPAQRAHLVALANGNPSPPGR